MYLLYLLSSPCKGKVYLQHILHYAASCISCLCELTHTIQFLSIFQNSHNDEITQMLFLQCVFIRRHITTSLAYNFLASLRHSISTTEIKLNSSSYSKHLSSQVVNQQITYRFLSNEKCIFIIYIMPKTFNFLNSSPTLSSIRTCKIMN